MNKTITVDAAISRGRRMISYPAFVIMIVTMGLTVYLGAKKVIPNWGFPVGFIVAFVLMRIWWSFRITKWRLWAFEHVRNVHELKKRAIQEKLIWADNSFFEKTAIRSSEEKEKLRLLEQRFGQEDIFLDDLTITDETAIFYSKRKKMVEMIAMLGCLAVGIYLLITGSSYIFGIVLSVIGVYFGFKEYKDGTNTTPQIVINNKGITTIATGFYNWSDIKNEAVICKGAGEHIHYYLVYDYPGGAVYLKIDEYDINQRTLNKLLRIYRGRSGTKPAKV